MVGEHIRLGREQGRLSLRTVVIDPRHEAIEVGSIPADPDEIHASLGVHIAVEDSAPDLIGRRRAHRGLHVRTRHRRASGEEQQDGEEKRLFGFRAVYVFDVASTTGEELPEFATGAEARDHRATVAFLGEPEGTVRPGRYGAQIPRLNRKFSKDLR